MGLASYGEPTYIEKFRDIIRFDKKKLLINNLKYFSYQNGRSFFSKELLSNNDNLSSSNNF